MNEQALLEELKKYDTPCVTNVVATYPNSDMCLGLYHPWEGHWYTDESIRSMYPSLGRTVGYAVTVTYGLPDPGFNKLKFYDVCKAIEDSPKPVVLIVKQNMPEHIKHRNGLLGGNMMTAFKALGTVGVISDGPSRDIDEVRALNMQYMLTGACAGHGGFAVQEVNTPVEVGGMFVAPGEIIHMDESGAVKFPASRLQEVVDLCRDLSAFEAEKQAALSKCSDARAMADTMSQIYR